MKILVLNSGSGTLKLSLFEATSLSFHSFDKVLWHRTIEFKGAESNLKGLLEEGLKEVPLRIDLIGHRVVHGGDVFKKPTLINKKVKEEIRKLSILAPLHNPHNLQGIEVAESLFPGAQQVAVFDTSFHRDIPEVAATYPIPLKWRQEGIRRYGFHGISYQYCVERVEALLKRPPDKLIICHLGNGASLAAVRNKKGVDTTMGFTPMEGLMMGTRSGSIDPGILIFLQTEKNYTVQDIDRILNKESGLLGIAGSFDMRKVLEGVRRKEPYPLLAFNMFIYRLKQSIGAYAAAMDGLNHLCFTGGIGENSPEVREAVVQGLSFLGMGLNPKKNNEVNQDALISSSESKVDVCVVKTREDYMIAKLTLGLCQETSFETPFVC